MNYFIQRGKVRSQVINVPEGLPEILSDITREVLRCQPTTECLCQFIIDYLHSVIVARNKARIAKSVIDRALLKVDEIISDMCVCEIPAMKAEEMALAMEECFKHFIAKRRCEIGKDKEIIQFADIDILDDLIHRCKFSNDELKISRPVLEAAYQRFADVYMTAQTDADSTEALYQYFRQREIKREMERQQNEAATKIQAVFRGFITRRTLFSEKSVSAFKIVEPLEASDTNITEQEEAARKIQKFFRSRISQRKSEGQALLDAESYDPASELDLYDKTTKVAAPRVRDDIPHLEGSAPAKAASINPEDAAKPQEIQIPPSETPVTVAEDANADKQPAKEILEKPMTDNNEDKGVSKEKEPMDENVISEMGDNQSETASKAQPPNEDD